MAQHYRSHIFVCSRDLIVAIQITLSWPQDKATNVVDDINMELFCVTARKEVRSLAERTVVVSRLSMGRADL